MVIEQTKQEATVQEREVWLWRTEEAFKAEHEAEFGRRVVFQCPTQRRAPGEAQETETGLFPQSTANFMLLECALKAKYMKP